MVRSFAPVLAALVLAGCGEGFVAGLRVTITLPDGVSLDATGGYEITLLAPDGQPLPGITPAFAAFREGPQTVGVRLVDESHFTSDGRLDGRLIVRAVPAEGAPPLAAGSVPVALTASSKPTELTVTLVSDPRPLTGTMRVRYATDWEAVDRGEVSPGTHLALEAWTATAPAGLAFHLWLCEPDCETALTWLGRVGPDDTGALFPTGEGALVSRPLEILVTAEPADITGQLAAPTGWPVARGTPAKAVVDGELASLIDPDGGVAWRIVDLVDLAETHAGFAGTAPPSESYARQHTWHAFFALVSIPDADVLDPAGLTFESDPVGLIDATGDGSPGYLTGLDVSATNAAEIDGSDEVADALLALRGCLGSLRTLTTTARLSGLAVDTAPDAIAAAAQFDSDVQAVHAALQGSGAFSVPCTVDLAEGLTVVGLKSVARGQP